MTSQEQVLKHHDDGVTIEGIARTLDIEIATVQRHLREAGRVKGINTRHACTDGSNLTDPKRADRLLRRFSWQDAP